MFFKYCFSTPVLNRFATALRLSILLVIISGAVNFHVQAKPAQQWMADQKVPGYLDDTFTPFLLVDQNRTVYAFTSQWIDDGDRRLAVIYRKWSLAGGWTRPVDVLLTASGDAVFLGAFLDSAGMIHVIFANTEGHKASIYYASAPAANADSALAWSTPTVIGTGITEVNSASLSGDGKGNLMIIYSGNSDGNGVYAIHSLDAGQTWSEPAPIFLTQSAELIPYSLRLIAGSGNQLRATWNVVTSLGVDASLYFSSYDITTAKWSLPLELDKRPDIPDYFGPSFPSIVDNGKEIVIMYNGGNPFSGRPINVGRPVQRVTVSTNNGQIWSDPINPFQFQLGRSGEHSLVLDGADRAHALFVQRIESEVNGKYSIIAGIWHSVYQGNGWTNPDLLLTTDAPHDVRSVVVQGNVLLVVWREDPGQGKDGVWYSYSILDIPESLVVPLPPMDVPTPAIPLDTPLPVSVVTATPVKLTEAERAILNSQPNPAAPFLIGIVPVVLVLAVVVIAYRFLRTHQ